MKRLLATIFVSAAVASACGGSSPASPSSGSPATGATVSGIVSDSGGSASTMSSGRPAGTSLTTGMTVSVVGTNISAPVDGSSRFTLRNVPAGNPQFKFSSSGVDAMVGISGVSDSEMISVAVSVTPTSAVIESMARSSGSTSELEGRIEAFPPSPAGSLVVAGRNVTTDASTRIVQGGATLTFDDLEVGQRVHVKGTSSSTSMLASIIELQNTNVDIPEPINGIIQNFTGTASAFQFEINGRLIKGDAATDFYGDSSFADMANGKRAEVKGALRDGFVYAVRMKVEGDDDEGGQEESASIEGRLNSIGGSAPTLTLVIGTTTVTTTSSTEVQRKGDRQELSVLAVGMTIHAVGDRQSDGSIIARKLQIKDDEAGGEFQISGSAGGLKGACPSLTFKVNGYDIFTDGSTTFVTPCSGLKSGNAVKVKGIVQSNGSVKATSVEKQ